jgi:hypothetical protein
MGTDKDRHAKAIDNWHAKLKGDAEKIVCPMCDKPIQSDDRDIYSEKGMCRSCDNALAIDD